jgi:hypothetical protein
MASNRPRTPKPTKAQVEQRVADVLAIRLAGAQLWDVREYVREKEAEDGSPWRLADGQKPLSDSQLYRYIDRADKCIASACLASRKKLLRRHRAQRQYLYGLAVSQGDVRAALACLDSEAKLAGLFEDELTRQLDQLQRQIAELKGNGHGNPAPATGATAGGTDGAGPPGAPGAGPAAG